jgi:hypothetical protein
MDELRFDKLQSQVRDFLNDDSMIFQFKQFLTENDYHTPVAQQTSLVGISVRMLTIMRLKQEDNQKDLNKLKSTCVLAEDADSFEGSHHNIQDTRLTIQFILDTFLDVCSSFEVKQAWIAFAMIVSKCMVMADQKGFSLQPDLEETLTFLFPHGAENLEAFLTRRKDYLLEILHQFCQGPTRLCQVDFGKALALMHGDIHSSAKLFIVDVSAKDQGQRPKHWYTALTRAYEEAEGNLGEQANYAATISLLHSFPGANQKSCQRLVRLH